MNTILTLLAVAAAVVGIAAIFSPRVRQALRIWGDKGLSKATTAVERSKDRVKKAIAALPAQRERVARLMTAAGNAQTAVTNKETEAETLLTKYQAAVTMNATKGTQDAVKLQWKTATGAVAGLKTAAAAAHQAAEDAQTELEDFLTTIKQSENGVAQLEADATLAAIYRESTAFRQSVNDLKNGLGDGANDKKEVQDELATAKNASELSKGSEADREMAQIEKQVQVNDADKEIEAALAARAAKNAAK